MLKRVFLLVFSLQAVRQVLAPTFPANLMKKRTYFCAVPQPGTHLWHPHSLHAGQLTGTTWDAGCVTEPLIHLSN